MLKQLPAFFIAIIVFTSCTKDPDKVAVPEPTVTCIVNDTMQLSPITIANFPDLYNIYHDKTYSRETNKVKLNYKVEGADVLIIFEH